MHYKKSISLLLVFILGFSNLFFSSSVIKAKTLEGMGTAASPYIIRTADDLNQMNTYSQSYFILANDLDYGGITLTYSLVKQFGGNFNGNGFTIRNLRADIDASSMRDRKYGILFNEIYEGTVSNLTFDNCSINIEGLSLGTGILAGNTNNANITNIQVTNAEVHAPEGEDAGGLTGSNINSVITGCTVISTNIYGERNAGGLCGDSPKTVINCHTLGGFVTGWSYIGGLIGDARILDLQKSSSTMDVTAENAHAGGLIGDAENSRYQVINVDMCYTNNIVISESYAGGLIGYANTTDGTINISNSYSLSTVKSLVTASGIVTVKANVPKMSLKNLFFAGDVQDALSIVPISGTAQIENSYYNSDLLNVSPAGITARTTEEMYTESNYESWDFTNTWTITEGEGYPKLSYEKELPDNSNYNLRTYLSANAQIQLFVTEDLKDNADMIWLSSHPTIAVVDAGGIVTGIGTGTAIISVQEADGPYTGNIEVIVSASDGRASGISSVPVRSIGVRANGSGTKESPYLINSVEDFYAVKKNTAAHYRLINDLDFLDTIKYDTIIPEFTGVLDGNGYTIRNLNILYDNTYNSYTKENLGIFGTTKNAVIQDLKIENVNVTIERNEYPYARYDGVAVLAGTLDSSEAVNISISGCTINAEKNGRILGAIAGTIKNNSRIEQSSVANTTIIGNLSTGALCGSLYDSAIIDCSAINYTSNTDSRAGALCGNITRATVSGCFASGGLITERSGFWAGGLVGSAEQSRIYQCYTTADVTSNGNYAGGLVGEGKNVVIEQCYTNNTVKASKYTGGILGERSVVIGGLNKIVDSYSLSKLISKDESAGITPVEKAFITVNNCFSAAVHQNASIKTGLSGGSVSNSYFDKSLADSKSTDVNSRTPEQMKQSANYIGWDFDTVWFIEEGSTYPRLRFENNSIPEIPEQKTYELRIGLTAHTDIQLAVNEELERNSELIWITSDNGTASVNGDGIVTGLSKGRATIGVQAPDGSYRDEIKILVTDKMKLYHLTINLNAGKTCRLMVEEDKPVIWNSSVESIAAVNQSGKVTAISKGLALITVQRMDGTVIDQMYIRVK